MPNDLIASNEESAEHTMMTLKLFIMGASPNSAKAISNIKSICEQHIPGRYDFEIIDLYQHPIIFFQTL